MRRLVIQERLEPAPLLHRNSLSHQGIVQQNGSLNDGPLAAPRVIADGKAAVESEGGGEIRQGLNLRLIQIIRVEHLHHVLHFLVAAAYGYLLKHSRGLTNGIPDLHGRQSMNEVTGKVV